MAEETKGVDSDLPAVLVGKTVDKEFAALYEAAVKEGTALAEAGNLNGALARLLAAEKKTRSGGDSTATAKLATLMLQMCWDASNLDQLNAYILIISKRRQQSGRAIAAVVQTAMRFLEEVKDKAERVKLITTLRTVSAGRIFVELERARLTKTLSEIHEADGDIDKASEILQEVAVETCGAMEKHEKADFLLEQLRLTIAQKDFIRTEIVSRKVNTKTLSGDDMGDLRVKFHKLMIQLHTFQKKPMALCRDWEAIFQVYSGGKEPEEDKWHEALKSVALFVCLSPHDNEQHDLLHRINANKKLDELPAFKALLTHFTTKELAPWPLPEQDELSAFMESVPGDWAELFHKRVVQHNVRVFSTYYKRIRFSRFAQLIGQDEEAAERFLSEMVSDKMIYARIDRPMGIISFKRPADASETLTDWAGNIGELLKLVETSCHLINKERMVHADKKARKARK